jgi:hypothetical protein
MVDIIAGASRRLQGAAIPRSLETRALDTGLRGGSPDPPRTKVNVELSRQSTGVPPARTAHGHQPQITPRETARHKDDRKPPAFNLRRHAGTLPLPEQRHDASIRANSGAPPFAKPCRRGDVYVAADAGSRRSIRARAAGWAHGARPNWLDRLRPALPSPPPAAPNKPGVRRRGYGTGSPSRPDAAAEEARPKPKGEGVEYHVPGAQRRSHE